MFKTHAVIQLIRRLKEVMLFEELVFKGGKWEEKDLEVDLHHQTWMRRHINRCGSKSRCHAMFAQYIHTHASIILQRWTCVPFFFF